MTDSLFKKAIFISLLGHLAMFGLFSFSLGYKLSVLAYPKISFYGAILRHYDLINKQPINFMDKKRIFKESNLLTPKIQSVISSAIFNYQLKPFKNISLCEEKPIFQPKLNIFYPKRKEVSLMLYPTLPSHFMFYFKDRQIVHMEIMFNVSSPEGINFIEVKRKISSGNLEADLLCMRYISHYLFIQHQKFPLNNWQTVKIDLSTQKQ